MIATSLILASLVVSPIIDDCAHYVPPQDEKWTKSDYLAVVPSYEIQKDIFRLLGEKEFTPISADEAKRYLGESPALVAERYYVAKTAYIGQLPFMDRARGMFTASVDLSENGLAVITIMSLTSKTGIVPITVVLSGTGEIVKLQSICFSVE